MKKDNSFVKAGTVLVAAGFIVKVLSAAYRIPLTRMLGAGMMGKYSSVFNIFMPFFSFASAGIIPTVSRFASRLKADNDTGGTVVMARRALKVYIAIAAIMMAGYLIFSRVYAAYMNEKIFYTGALILSPCIVLASAESVFKGLTQGQMKMMVTAKANVMESTVKTVLGISSVFFILNYIKDYPANLPVNMCFLSVTAAAAVCVVYLLCVCRLRKTDMPPQNTVTAGNLLSMSVPISMSALVMAMVNFFDTAVCLPAIRRLPYDEIVKSFDGASFMGAQEHSMYLYGIYQGMAVTVFNLVPAVMASVGAACLPVLSKANNITDKGYFSRQTDRLFSITAFISVPAAVYIFVFRNQIITFLFSTNRGQTVIAADLLAILIVLCPAACFTSAFNSIIHSFGKSSAVFKILVIASTVKCILGIAGCSVAGINIKGLAVSAAAFYAIIFILSAIYIKKLGVKFSALKILLPPAAVSVAIICIVMLFYKKILFCMPVFLQLMFSGTVFCLSYVLVMFMLGFKVDI